MSKEKNLELDRLVFFSEAVVAIAITLLALDLRLEKTDIKGLLSFKDMAALWTKFSAFFLSFILIAVFWKIHHQFFAFVKKIDDRLLWYNIFWLLCIITLPFSTTLVSAYFGQTVSVFTYSINILLITIFQNQIWDHVAVRPDYLNDKADGDLIYNYRFDCNVAMINAGIAVVLSFVSPIAGFLVLFARPVMMITLKKIYKRAKPIIMTENQLSKLKDNNVNNLGEENKINKPYLVGVLLLTLILPLLCGFTEWISGNSVFFSLELIGKWVIFWSVGMRQFMAGLKQAFNPSFTAKTIFRIENKESHVIVKELGFANICFGLIGIISFFLPQWRIVSAFGSGLFYGIAGVNHLLKKRSGPNEKIALVSDIFIFIVLMIYIAFTVHNFFLFNDF
ncbi:MAG: TMEM175 family protein [Chitinophagaceae bacterium]